EYRAANRHRHARPRTCCARRPHPRHRRGPCRVRWRPARRDRVVSGERVKAASPLGSYLPGRGPLHRLRPGAKLAGLFTLAVAVMATSGAWWTAGWIALGALLIFMSGLRGTGFWRVARGFALIGIPLFAFQAWQHGWQQGFTVVGNLLALIFAASAVTA